MCVYVCNTKQDTDDGNGSLSSTTHAPILDRAHILWGGGKNALNDCCWCCGRCVCNSKSNSRQRVVVSKLKEGKDELCGFFYNIFLSNIFMD